MARILVIDDDGMVRSTMSRILRSHGHEVVLAADGGAGMAALKQESADLVITDIIMPNREGIETIIALRRRHRGVKIIAMSGGGRLGDADMLAIAARLGASDTISKPFTSDQLIARVAACLAAA